MNAHTKLAFLTLAFLPIPLLPGRPVLAAPTFDELKIGISQEFENPNPVVMQMTATHYLYYMTARTLDTMDAKGKWVPMLAKKIPTLEDGTAKFTPDHKQIQSVWEIKDEAKWSDGHPVTCEDFDFARTVAMSPNVSVPDKESYEQVAKIEWDPATPKKCLFTFAKARWDFYQLGTFNALPKHLEEPIFKKYGGQKEGYEKNSNYVRHPEKDGLACGPYKVSEVVLGSHVSLIPNPYFYGEKPKFKRIVVKLIPNTGTFEANLRSGTIDMISSLGISFQQALALEKKVKVENLPFVVNTKPSLMYEHIDLNMNHPILKDPKVRKALVYGIDREEMVKALFEGKQEVALHYESPMSVWFTKDPKKITLYPYNRREAARLLDQAGWKMDRA
ncbi:MAG: ABC transporter substrate-binding protein, partial [Bdellovibrio sp.]